MVVIGAFFLDCPFFARSQWAVFWQCFAREKQVKLDHAGSTMRRTMYKRARACTCSTQMPICLVGGFRFLWGFNPAGVLYPAL